MRPSFCLARADAPKRRTVGYRYTENSDGTLTLHDFALMATLSAGEKNIQDGINEAWLDDAIAKHKTAKRSVFLFEGHNEIDTKTGNVTRYAPIVGRAEPDSLYRNGSILYASEVKVSDPRHVAMFKRNLQGNQSAEFFAKSRRILGTALLGGIPGHQDDKLPEPRLEGLDDAEKAELAALAAAEPLSTGRVAAKGQPMTPDEIKKLVADTVADAIKSALPDALKTLRGDAIDLMDPAADPNALIKGMVEGEVAKLKADHDIKTKVAVLLARKGNLFSENQLTARFQTFKTEEGRTGEFHRLNMIANRAEAEVVMREEPNLAIPAVKLAHEAEKSWAEREGEWKAQGYTKESFTSSYVAMNSEEA